MFFAIFFAFWRFMQILTLIPTVGMLGYFVNAHASNNLLTPTFVLVLFIVSVLGLAWSIFTLFSYHRSSHNARFVSLIDLLFVGALIAAVYQLAFIASANCVRFESTSSWGFYFGDFSVDGRGGFVLRADQTCAMLKASFAFGIMNCIFFFFTAVLAWFHGDHHDHHRHSGERVVKETRRYRSGSRRPRHRSASHHGSRRSSHHSHHSRVYV